MRLFLASGKILKLIINMADERVQKMCTTITYQHCFKYKKMGNCLKARM